MPTRKRTINKSASTPSVLTETDPLQINEESKSRSIDSDPQDISRKNLEDFHRALCAKEGSNCGFILGNGVSIPFGTDSWDNLVHNLLDYLSPFYTESAEKIDAALAHSLYLIASFVKHFSTQKSMGEKEDDDNKMYRSALRYCIYRKYNPIMHEKKESLLRAVALAKLKYKELTIYTYNYDLFLENQIKFEDPEFGSSLLSTTKFNKMRKTSIFHLHGIVFNEEGKQPQDLILSDEDYYKEYFNPTKKDRIRNAQLSLLKKKTVLFVGSSMSDFFQLSLIADTKRQNPNWKCYALMCLKGLEKRDQRQLIAYYEKKGIFIIFGESFDELPFLLGEIADINFSESDKQTI